MPADRRPYVIDVRSEEEFAGGAIPGAVNLPIDELRDHLDELPRDRPLIAYCQVGMRGYLATRLLKQHGFDVENLSGGYKTYQQFAVQRSKAELSPCGLAQRRVAVAGRWALRLALCLPYRSIQCPIAASITIEQSGAFVETFDLPPTGDGPLTGLRFAVKDLIDVAGHADRLRQSDLEGDASAGGGACGVRGSIAGGRARLHRQDGDRRVGVQPDRRESFLRHAAESARAESSAGRIVQRIGFGGGVRAGRFRVGDRHGRIGARAGEQLRHLGIAADAWNDQRGRRDALCADVRYGGHSGGEAPTCSRRATCCCRRAGRKSRKHAPTDDSSLARCVRIGRRRKFKRPCRRHWHKLRSLYGDRVRETSLNQKCSSSR